MEESILLYSLFCLIGINAYLCAIKNKITNYAQNFTFD